VSDLSSPSSTDLAAADPVSALLAALAVPAWLHRPGAPLQANPALQRLCGHDAAALSATEHLQMVAESDRATLAEATEACLHGSGEPPAVELQLLARGGGSRQVELTLRRLSGLAAGQGGPAVLVTCIDHSDFLHVQAMLQSMSGMLRQIIDGAPVASYVIDCNHRVTHWNTACERLTGCSADDMLGTDEAWRAFYPQPQPLLAEMVVDNIAPDLLQERHGAAARPSPLLAGAYEKEAFFPHLGEAGLWLDFTAAPLRNAGGEIMGAIVTLQDVSERRRNAEELTRRLETMVSERSAELAAHAQLMDALIDNAPFGVVYTVNNRVQRANRRMAEVFGHRRVDAPAAQDMGGRDFHLDAGDSRVLINLAQPCFAQHEPLHHEMWMQHASGKPLWVQVNAFPVEYSDDSTGAWWMLQDRSEMRSAQEALAQRYEELKDTNRKLEQAQNQLLQQDKMASIGQLAAGVAHEINNPVGFVSSNLHTLRQYVDSLLALVDAQERARAAPGDAALTQALEVALETAELDYLKEDLPVLLDESADGLTRVKKIVQDLKDFSRVDQSDWQQADLNAGVESTLNVVRNEVKYKCEVVRQLQPLPLVTCLAAQLNQVFMNLIVNASHAIADKGTITLSSGAQDGWVWVQVDDTGCGMSDEVRRRVFEPFFTTKEVGKGTGLGLSLSFSIVKRHGGEIQARSTPGVGSQFRVWVPVAGPQPAGSPAATPPDWA